MLGATYMNPKQYISLSKLMSKASKSTIIVIFEDRREETIYYNPL